MKNAEIEDKPTEAALEGTAAHSLCEYKVKHALGENVKDPTEDLDYYNAEMEESAEGYMQFVLEQVEKAKQSCSDPIVFVEQKLDFTKYVGWGGLSDYFKESNPINKDLAKLLMYEEYRAFFFALKRTEKPL